MTRLAACDEGLVVVTEAGKHGSVKKSPFDYAERTFICVAALLLIATATAKFTTAFGSHPVLYEHDPIFVFLTNREVLLTAGTIELVVCATFLRKTSINRLLPLACLSLVFLTYKSGLAWFDLPTHRCPCLGLPESWPSLDKMMLTNISDLILGFFLTGSFGLILWNCFRRTRLIAGT